MWYDNFTYWYVLLLGGVKRRKECDTSFTAKIDRAYEIIEHAWGEEFEKKREYFMEPFRETYREMGLDVIALCK